MMMPEFRFSADDAHRFMKLAPACEAVADLFFGDVSRHQDLVADLTGGLTSSAADPEKFSAEFAALHYQLFALNIFPFGNVYVSETLMAGGELGTKLKDIYADAEFNPASDVTADHFGVQFAAAGYLLLTTVEHWRHGNRDRLLKSLRQLQHLTQQCLIPSLIPVTAAFAGEKEPFAVNLSQVICPLALELSACSDAAGAPPPPQAARDDELPSQTSGVEALVRYLLTPVRCGFWTGAGDIRALAARFALPCGFSTREDMLTNLLHAAGTYEQVPQLLAAIAGIVEKRREALTCWRSPGQDTIIDSIVHRTESRLTRTVSLLEQFRQHATRGHSPD